MILRGKHCWRPIAVMGVVDTLEHWCTWCARKQASCWSVSTLMRHYGFFNSRYMQFMGLPQSISLFEISTIPMICMPNLLFSSILIRKIKTQESSWAQRRTYILVHTYVSLHHSLLFYSNWAEMNFVDKEEQSGGTVDWLPKNETINFVGPFWQLVYISSTLFFLAHTHDEKIPAMKQRIPTLAICCHMHSCTELLSWA